MFGIDFFVVILYGLCIFSALSVMKGRSLTCPKKIILANILLACTVYLSIFCLNKFVDGYRVSWYGASLMNGLTYLHVVHMIKEIPQNAGNGRCCKKNN